MGLSPGSHSSPMTAARAERAARSRDGVFFATDRHGNRVFRLQTSQPIAYDVTSTRGIVSETNPTLAERIPSTIAFCVVDSALKNSSWPELRSYLAAHGVVCHEAFLEPTESQKTLAAVADVARTFTEAGISRRDTVLCVGGGITCDVGGLAANLLRRGTPCVKVPTTLLAVVDAAVGVKTGVNFARHKNFLGTYYPPTSVVYDLELLRGLPDRQVRNGLVEIAKVVAVKSRETWALFERHAADLFRYPLGAEATTIIEQAILYMLEELQPNLFETSLLRIVDYGHEFGHAIETATEHELEHGEAVAIGMLLSNSIAVRRGILREQDADAIARVLTDMGCAACHPALTPRHLREAMEAARRHKHSGVHLVSLKAIGDPCFLESIKDRELDSALEDVSRIEGLRRSSTHP